MTDDLNLWIDDGFRVQEKYYGTWVSYNKNNEELITSLTREECINATRWYLKQLQENAFVTSGPVE